MATNPDARENPLLLSGGLPRFDEIEPAHVEPALRALLAELERDLDAIESEPSRAGRRWSSRSSASAIGCRLAWGIVGHLMGVSNSDALRDGLRGRAARRRALLDARRAEPPLYRRARRSCREGPAWAASTPPSGASSTALVRDAELARRRPRGRRSRQRFNAIQTELAERSTRFSNHVLDATKACSPSRSAIATRSTACRGARSTWRHRPRAAGDGERDGRATGPWRITLDHPSYVPFMQHAAAATCASASTARS